ncbi:hypothetical protein [Spirosoma sp. KNUC1025]|uniref:hypothetical protein n=1 Tax=Spirosoma sp. KNUC1025 TaxID=2894082 RepID=UPI00386369A2|nr:hypothetical protein LN737_09625 [Spirosoma sp. KNUC1025]
MANLVYPDFNQYQLPKKNVLVISCMDLRLTDDLVDFLHNDNLANRYDHFILAGASLCATTHHHSLFKEKVLADYGNFTHWKNNLFEHLQLAVDLHDIRDVYIIEHQDCGAYREFLKDGDFANNADESECHRKFAEALSGEISAKEYYDQKKQKPYKLHVHCFFIDLRGDVELMHTTAKQA